MTQTAFRCYYDDGTITVSDVCPPQNQYGSPLINSEFQIIEDVTEQIQYPWFLIILGIMFLLSKGRK